MDSQLISAYNGFSVNLKKLPSNSEVRLQINIGRAMVHTVSRRPLTAAARVRTQVNPVRFVVDKVALGQVFLRVLRFRPVNIIPPWVPHFRELKKIVPSLIHFINSFTHQ
jgi:hypothetical protein